MQFEKVRSKGTKIVVILSQVLVLAGFSSSPQGVRAEEAVNKGVGPVTAVKLESIDSKLVNQGKKVFETKCSACHKIGERYVGPALSGVTKRRSPEWIMNMILNPSEMLQKDPVAQELLAEYLTQMTFQNVPQAEARAILEYFRKNDEKAK